MELRSKREVEVTRDKLRSLENRYRAVKQEPGTDTHIQELTLRSLKRMINQMKEEIARFESRESLQSPLT
jgi:ribosome-interacting GTPase 1